MTGNPENFFVIVCDGCRRERDYVGQIHEIVHDPADRFPELCGRGIRIHRNYLRTYRRLDGEEG